VCFNGNFTTSFTKNQCVEHMYVYSYTNADAVRNICDPPVVDPIGYIIGSVAAFVCCCGTCIAAFVYRRMMKAAVHSSGPAETQMMMAPQHPQPQYYPQQPQQQQMFYPQQQQQPQYYPQQQQPQYYAQQHQQPQYYPQQQFSAGPAQHPHEQMQHMHVTGAADHHADPPMAHAFVVQQHKHDG